MNTKSSFTRAIFAALALIAVAARAQSVGDYALTSSTTATGGGTSSGGQFTVSGTIGQPDAGWRSGGQFTLEGGFWNGVQVVQVCGAPVLQIKFVGTNAVLSWPAGVTGYSLEAATLVASATWNATPQAIVDMATEHTVTVPASGVLKVFRLKK